MSTENSEPKDVAVFFDFENIVFSVRNNYNINANFEDLMDKCKEFGRVVVARAFADWSRHSSAMITSLISNGFDPVYVPSFTTTNEGQSTIRKNAVDMYMAIDAMDVLHSRKNVGAFVLLTGDSDFLPLINAVRREGKDVIAIGVDGSTSSHLVQSVDEFILYSQVSNLPSDTPRKKPQDIYEGLVFAIKELYANNKSTVLPNVKMAMVELMGGFDETKYSDTKGRRYQKFKEFVQEAEKRGLVRLVTTGTVNEVFLPEEKQQRGNDKPKGKSFKKEENGANNGADYEPRVTPAPVYTPPAVETPAPTPAVAVSAPVAAEPVAVTSSAVSPELDAGYRLLARAAQTALDENRSARVSSIKDLMVNLQAGFDEKKLIAPDGKPFSRFSDFVNAAEEAGYIQFVGKGTRKEIRPSVPTTAAPAAPKATPAAKPVAPKAAPKAAEPVAEQVETVTTPEPTNGNGDGDDADFYGTTPGVNLTNMVQLDETSQRKLIVDSLRTFNAYPAPFLKIEAHCRNLRNDRQVFLPSPKVRDLLTLAAREVGLLRRLSPPGVSPAQYDFNEDPALIASFIGVGEGEILDLAAAELLTTAPTAAPVTTPPAVVEEPVAEDEPAEQGKKRRGRPAKEKAEVVVEQPAKKRGRPAKEKVETKANQPQKKRGRPAKEVSLEEINEEKASKKRGRPRKEDKKQKKQKKQKEAQATEQLPPLELQTAYQMLATVVQDCETKNMSSRASVIRRQLGIQQPEFNEKRVYVDGQPFARFTDFVLAAEAAGVVKTSGQGLDLHVHSI